MGDDERGGSVVMSESAAFARGGVVTGGKLGSGGGAARVGVDEISSPNVDRCRRCFTTSVARATSSSCRCSGVKCPYKCESDRPEGHEHSINKADKLPHAIFGATARHKWIVCGLLATLRLHYTLVRTLLDGEELGGSRTYVSGSRSPQRTNSLPEVSCRKRNAEDSYTPVSVSPCERGKVRTEILG